MCLLKSRHRHLSKQHNSVDTVALASVSRRALPGKSWSTWCTYWTRDRLGSSSWSPVHPGTKCTYIIKKITKTCLAGQRSWTPHIRPSSPKHASDISQSLWCHTSEEDKHVQTAQQEEFMASAQKDAMGQFTMHMVSDAHWSIERRLVCSKLDYWRRLLHTCNSNPMQYCDDILEETWKIMVCLILVKLPYMLSIATLEHVYNLSPLCTPFKSQPRYLSKLYHSLRVSSLASNSWILYHPGGCSPPRWQRTCNNWFYGSIMNVAPQIHPPLSIQCISSHPSPPHDGTERCSSSNPPTMLSLSISSSYFIPLLSTSSCTTTRHTPLADQYAS